MAALEKKSEDTIWRAVERDPENLREVMRVTVPAIMRQQMALTPLRKAVSLKFPPGGAFPISIPSRYCFFCCSSRASSVVY